jgi:hypothetical protein
VAAAPDSGSTGELATPAIVEASRRPGGAPPAAATALDPGSTGDIATPEIIGASDGRGGAPRAGNAFTCENDAAPIRDPYDRTWRVKKISYSTQAGFERVILHLARIGEARPGGRTAAIAGRVPTSRITDFPEAVRPEKRQRRLLRVDLAGVPVGPDLRGFRLLGLGNIGEVSLLPGRNGRTALLAIDGDACYRVRVPAWGSEVDPDASQAEVVIDVKDR